MTQPGKGLPHTTQELMIPNEAQPVGSGNGPLVLEASLACNSPSLLYLSEFTSIVSLGQSNSPLYSVLTLHTLPRNGLNRMDLKDFRLLSWHAAQLRKVLASLVPETSFSLSLAILPSSKETNLIYVYCTLFSVLVRSVDRASSTGDPQHRLEGKPVGVPVRDDRCGSSDG